MKLSRQAIDRPRVALVAAAMIMAIAVFATLQIPVQRTPAIHTAVVIVAVPYPGGKPHQAEKEITRKLEDSLKRLDRVDWMESSSMRGSSVTIIVFLDGVDPKRARDDVAHLVNAVRHELPLGREVMPTVTAVDFESAPVMLVALLAGKQFDQRSLKTIAEEVQDELEGISGVANSALFGGREREIHVSYDPELLAQYQLSVNDLRNALATGHASMPGGAMNTGQFNLQVRAETEFRGDEDIQKIRLRPDRGQLVRMSDVAHVADTYRRPLSVSQIDGKNCATILVNKEPNINTLATAQAVKAKVDELRLKYPDIEFAYTRDTSAEIGIMFWVLGSSAVWGGLLVMLILQFSMGFRASALVLLAIPISTAVAVSFLYMAGISISNMVIFSYILVLGMVVDGAIIVVENIHRHQEMGKTPQQAAKDGIDEVGIPVLAADLTTIAAYAPMLLVPGIMGDFLSVMPIVVGVALAGSLLVDHFLIPVVASLWTAKVHVHPQIADGQLPAPRNWFSKGYAWLLNYSLHNRFLVLAYCVLSVVWAGWMLGSGAIAVDFFPSSDRGQFSIIYELPLGYSIEETLRASECLTEPLKDLEKTGELQHFVTAIGSGGALTGPLEGDSASGPEFGQVVVELTPPMERKRHQDEIIEELRAKIKPWPGMKFRIETAQEGPPGGAAVEVRLTGDNLEQLGRVAERLAARMRQIPSTRDVSTDYRPLSPDVVAQPDPALLALYGLDKRQVSEAIATAIQGESRIELLIGDEEVPIRLQALPSYQSHPADIQRLRLTAPNGQQVTLGQVAHISREQGLFSIRRRDNRRAVSVRCNLQDKKVNPAALNAAQTFDELRKILPQEYGFRPSAAAEVGTLAVVMRELGLDISTNSQPMIFVGQPDTDEAGVRAIFTGEEEERQKNFSYLNTIMLLALLLIGFILVIQFNSLRQTIIVLLAIPLSFVGVVAGMWIFGFAFSLASFIGLVSLAGVVVNDAIVMVDFTNQSIARGMSVNAALMEAGRCRLRPVFLPTITIIGGLFPMFLNLSGGAEFWQPLTGAIICGLTFATALTLVVIPVAYSLVYSGWQTKTE